MAEITVIAFGEKVEIHLAQQGVIAIGVFGDLLATGPVDFQQIGLALREMPDEKTRRAA
jgi:hypothetical protein